MRTAVLTAVVVALGVTVGCTQAIGTTSPSATPSSSQLAVDLTAPGQARSMVRKLIAKAGTPNLIQVEITQEWAAITVVKDSQAQAWAWRDNTVKQVDTDVAYVQQATFSIDDFNINDVGGLFRAAAGISGSDSSQELQIVDSSAGEVFMSVSTVPESRTVFFEPDGAILPTLDFAIEGGVEQGLADVMGQRTTANAVGVQSSLGAWLDYQGSTTTTVRRLRTPTVPVTINERGQRTELPTFDVSLIDPKKVWHVLALARSRGDFDAETRWEVTIDDRNRTGVPRMYFTIAGASLVTDLDGREIQP
ncbi:hypothetical protein [Micropruina sonneratiae]|uniref:hypothetical protein n=1 Tax=Micropruina sonneratiae TaxID=2986940 RepID=UPI002227B341|nr:hypothetical protein [Micropruina sp. KQZ13P-5]MCW3158872.1 hypothetical protein [Micropruina sp. KQZ13P-5]